MYREERRGDEREEKTDWKKEREEREKKEEEKERINKKIGFVFVLISMMKNSIKINYSHICI